jgi:hypothetical protein
LLWPSPTWWGVSHDTLIWRLPLDSDLRKRGLASRSEFANLGAGVAGSNPAVPTTTTNPLLSRTKTLYGPKAARAEGPPGWRPGR